MKKFKIIICIVIILFTFTGCKSSQSLSDLTIVQGIGVDLQDNKTKVSLQYLNLAKGGGSTESLTGNITTVAQGDGSNISDALSSTSKTLSKEIFFGQNKLVVFGMDYANDSLEKGMDYLLRSVDSRPDVLVAVSDDSAENILNSKERDAKVPAENIFNLLYVGEENGLGAVVTVNELLDLYSDKTSDIYLPVLKAEDDVVTCEGIAIFSDNKYKTTLNENQTFGFLFVKDKIDGGALTVKDSKLGNIGLEIINSKAKNNVEINNGKITFTCDIKLEVMLDEIEKGVTASVDEDKIKSIEKLANIRVKNMCLSAINTCLNNKSDPLLIGRYVAKADENYYNSVKQDWKNNFEDINVKINVKTDLVKVNDNSVRE